MSANPKTDVVDDVAMEVEAQVLSEVQTAYERHLSQLTTEAAAPHSWWDLYLIGPFQFGASPLPPQQIGGGPLLPHRVIRSGETFYFASVLFLNPNYPSGISAHNLLSNMACPYEINYYSGSLQAWSPAPYNTQVNGSFGVGQGPFHVNVVAFQAQKPDLIEMNVTARIMNCNNTPLPYFGGFATAIYQFDSGIFGPAEGFDFNIGARFLIVE